MKNEGRLGYNSTFYIVPGLGNLSKMKGISAIIVLFIYFWA